MAEIFATNVIDLETYRKRNSCAHCGQHLVREGELRGEAFYVHASTNAATCDPDAEASPLARARRELRVVGQFDF